MLAKFPKRTAEDQPKLSDIISPEMSRRTTNLERNLRWAAEHYGVGQVAIKAARKLIRALSAEYLTIMANQFRSAYDAHRVHFGLVESAYRKAGGMSRDDLAQQLNTINLWKCDAGFFAYILADPYHDEGEGPEVR